MQFNHADELYGWTEIDLPYICTVGWYQPTAGTADYFNELNARGQIPYGFRGIAGIYAGVPNNIHNDDDNDGEDYKNKQYAFRYDKDNIGQGYCGLVIARQYSRLNNGEFVDWKYRKNEYIQKKLAQPLQNGHKYMVSFRVSKAPDYSKEFSFCKKAFSAYFSKDPVTLNCDYPQP